MIKTKCILYFDLKVNEPIYCCFDGETIYCFLDDGTIKTSTPFAVRDINDSSFAWYKQKKRKTDDAHDEIDKYLESINHYEFKPCVETELGFAVGQKQNTFSFIEFLDSLVFISKKYIK